MRRFQEVCVLKQPMSVEDVETKRQRRLKRKAVKIEKIKLAGGCAVCGIEYDGANQCIFDLHHVNPVDKVCPVGKCKNLKDALREARKCEVVCSNCHRMLHKDD